MGNKVGVEGGGGDEVLGERGGVGGNGLSLTR